MTNVKVVGRVENITKVDQFIKVKDLGRAKTTKINLGLKSKPNKEGVELSI